MLSRDPFPVREAVRLSRLADAARKERARGARAAKKDQKAKRCALGSENKVTA